MRASGFGIWLVVAVFRRLTPENGEQSYTFAIAASLGLAAALVIALLAVAVLMLLMLGELSIFL